MRACFHAQFKAIKPLSLQYLWVRSTILPETKPSQTLQFGVSLTWICNPNRAGTGILILPAEKVVQGGFIKPGGEKAAQGPPHEFQKLLSFPAVQSGLAREMTFLKGKTFKNCFVLLNRKAKLGRKEFFGSLDRTPNKLQRAAHSQSSSSRQQMG